MINSIEDEKERISKLNIIAYNKITRGILLVKDQNSWIPPKQYKRKDING